MQIIDTYYVRTIKNINTTIYLNGIYHFFLLSHSILKCLIYSYSDIGRYLTMVVTDFSSFKDSLVVCKVQQRLSNTCVCDPKYGSVIQLPYDLRPNLINPTLAYIYYIGYVMSGRQTTISYYIYYNKVHASHKICHHKIFENHCLDELHKKSSRLS